jgi:Transposase
MRKGRFSEEQIVGFLKETQAGVPVKELCRRVTGNPQKILIGSFPGI